MARLIKDLVKTLINRGISREWRTTMGRFLLNYAAGDNNHHAESNGEYYFLRKLLTAKKTKSVMFDVGANLGEWSKATDALLVEGSIIYAFEPVKQTYDALANNASDTIKPFNMALGETEKKVAIYTSAPYAGTNSLVFNEYVGHTGKSEEVDSISGDVFCAQYNIGNIDFLKIDTEGYELKVLHGFDSMLTEGKIDFLQFEYGGTWIYSRSLLKDAVEYLQGRGYVVFKLHSDFLERFECYDPRVENFNYSNWIAMRKGLTPPLKVVPH